VQGAIFQKANLYGCKLQGVDARQADFRNADLRLANLGGAYLQGAMLPQPERAPLPSPSQIIANPTAYLPGADRGHRTGPAHGEKSVVEAEMERDRAGKPGGTEDGYQTDRNRNLPQEQRQDRTRGRGR
jgi:hypothetical protein